jgi:hypothetical protein
MHFDVSYSGLATRIGLFGVASGCAVLEGKEIAQKPPICRFFDRPAPANFFGEARFREQNSLDCRELEGSGNRSRALNPLARSLAISILTRHGEVS